MDWINDICGSSNLALCLGLRFVGPIGDDLLELLLLRLFGHRKSITTGRFSLGDVALQYRSLHRLRA